MEQRIRVKAMCLLEHNGRILVADGESLTGVPGGRPIVPGKFHRVLGGSLDFSETAEKGVRREIREELKCEIENLELLEVLENLFTYAGEPGHEVIFLFKGELADKSLHDQEIIHIIEDGYAFDAVWVRVEDLKKPEKRLYPKLDYSKYI